jgi:alkylation response protein AidB-like acyl-CoA dehydrogenase
MEAIQLQLVQMQDNTDRLQIQLHSGLVQDALDKALAFTKERKQFGQAIADFQATQSIEDAVVS